MKSRRADGTIYFLREEIDQIIDREIEVVRSGECKPDQLVSRMDTTCSEVASRRRLGESAPGSARARRVA